MNSAICLWETDSPRFETSKKQDETWACLLSETICTFCYCGYAAVTTLRKSFQTMLLKCQQEIALKTRRFWITISICILSHSQIFAAVKSFKYWSISFLTVENLKLNVRISKSHYHSHIQRRFFYDPVSSTGCRVLIKWAI